MDEGGLQSTQQAPARTVTQLAGGGQCRWLHVQMGGRGVGSVQTANLGAITVTTGRELVPSPTFTSPQARQSHVPW